MGIPQPVGNNALANEDRRRIELDCNTKFSLGNYAYSLNRRFFESDDTAWNVPTKAIELVAPSSEQCTSTIVLDQQVDVDERGDTAEKEKQLLGQPACLGVEPSFDFSD